MLNEMCGSRRTMHEGGVTTSQCCVLHHVHDCVRAMGPPPVDGDGVRVPGRAALRELLAKQGYGGGASVPLDINLLSLPSLLSVAPSCAMSLLSLTTALLSLSSSQPLPLRCVAPGLKLWRIQTQMQLTRRRVMVRPAASRVNTLTSQDHWMS